MILLLLLIPTFAIGSGIDWSTCKTTTRCYMHDKCNNKATTNLFEYREPDQIDECDIGYQIYLFSEDIALIQMQISGKMRDTDPELVVYHGDKRLFGCKRNKDGDIEVIADNELKKTHRIDLFEDRSSFESEHTICALKLDNMRKFEMKTLERLDSLYGRKSSKISYFDNEGKRIDFENPVKGSEFFKYSVTNCNPYSFLQSKQHSYENFHILPIKDLDKAILNCKSYNRFNYALRISRNGDINEVEKLTCEMNSRFYNMTLLDGSSELLDYPYDIEFFCTAEIEKFCENPYRECLPADGIVCPSFHAGTESTAASINCPQNKWLINGEYYPLKDTEKPICRADDAQNSAAFFIKSETEGDIRLEDSMNVSCFTSYDCSIKSVLDYHKCEDCGVLQYMHSKIMQCEDESKYQLTVTQPRSKTILKAKKYTCDGATGEWKDSEGVILERGARVRCLGDNLGMGKKEATFTKEHVSLIIGGVVAVSVIIIAAVVLCVWGLIKRRKRKNVKAVNKKQWKKTTSDQQLANIKSTMRDLMTATKNSDMPIVHGFEILEMLIDTNTSDPAIWDEVYPFLLRVSGTLGKIDFALNHLYARYLYLQAKKIIDKEGWLSSTPITNSNRDGLMRSVAVHLLAICMNDAYNDDIIQLIENGFRELGFNAVEQYPHCGLLWSLMTQLRSYCYDTTDSSVKYRGFDTEKFLSQLRKIREAPESELEVTDIIPQFGSISDQACFAIGGTKNENTFQEFCATTVTADQQGEKEIAARRLVKFLSGAGYHQDPGPRIFVGLNKFLPENLKGGKKIEVFCHDVLKSIDSGDVWNLINDIFIKIMIFFHRSHDTKKLEFLLLGRDINDTSESYFKLLEEQELFEDAVTDHIKELWAKFGHDVDIQELKNRPETLKFIPGISENPWNDKGTDPPILSGSSSSPIEEAAAVPAEAADQPAAPAAPEGEATPAAPTELAAAPEPPQNP